MPPRGGDLGLGAGARRRRPVVPLLLLLLAAFPARSCADAGPHVLVRCRRHRHAAAASCCQFAAIPSIPAMLIFN